MKSITKTICILGIIGVLMGTIVCGATEETVAATVTVQNVALTVADKSIDYGTLTTTDTKDTTTGAEGVDNTQTITNTGNVNEDFDIKGADSTSSGDGWALGAAGDETYAHKFCRVATETCDSSPTWTALTTTYAELTTAVAASATYDFDLQISTPTATTDFNEQTCNVLVQASAS